MPLMKRTVLSPRALRLTVCAGSANDHEKFSRLENNVAGERQSLRDY
jgi:hypothetical protein